MTDPCAWCLDHGDTPVITFAGWTWDACAVHARAIVDPFAPHPQPTAERLRVDAEMSERRIRWHADTVVA